MTNKAKAEIWAKVARTIEQRGMVALHGCGLCCLGSAFGLSYEDTYGKFDADVPISGVSFLMGDEGDNNGYLWPKTEEGAEQRAMAAQLMACFLDDEPDEEYQQKMVFPPDVLLEGL